MPVPPMPCRPRPMPGVLRVDAEGTEPAIRGGPGALERHLAPLPHRARLVIATHGMRHDPTDPALDPHRGVLADVANPDRHWKERSFIRALHLGEGQRLAGHGIAFGWDGRGPVWPALVRARRAGLALARLAGVIRTARPDLELCIVTHSLGARVVNEAMLRAPVPIFDRALLLAPADHRARAFRALQAPGGRTCAVVATQTPENWLCGLGFALATPAMPTLARGPDHPRWTDFHPDRLGMPPWPHRICHWSAFLRPGLWPLYRSWLLGDAGPGIFATPEPRTAGDPPAGPAPSALGGATA